MSEGKTYGLLLALLEPPEKMEEEFNEWYDQEHIPERKAIPGIITAQRFITRRGSPMLNSAESELPIWGG